MFSEPTIPLDLRPQDCRGSYPGPLAVHRKPAVDRSNLLRIRGVLESTQEDLRRAKLELGQLTPLAKTGLMTHFIAHDLRNYLCSINANMEFVMESKTLQEGSDELAEDVRAALRGMSDMLDSLLLFARTGEPLHPRLTLLNALNAGAMSLVRSHPDAQNIEFVMEEAIRVEAFVDGKKLGRAIYNLLLNACQAAKHGMAPGKVALRLLEDKGIIRIQVEDNGPGIPDSIRHALYEPFVSARSACGIGLGLTIVECTAREHGGTVDLEQSSPGRTVFLLQLPRTALQALAAASSLQAPRGGNHDVTEQNGPVRSFG